MTKQDVKKLAQEIYDHYAPQYLTRTDEATGETIPLDPNDFNITGEWHDVPFRIVDGKTVVIGLDKIEIEQQTADQNND